MRAAAVPTVPSLILAVPLLAGCGAISGTATGSNMTGSSTTGSSTAGSSTAGSGTAGSSTAGSGTNGSGAAAGPGPVTPPADSEQAGVSCAAAPVDLVATALGGAVSATQQTRNGDSVVVCDYRGPQVGAVTIRIQTDASASGFAADKDGFADRSMTTTEETFEDEAFSNVLGSGGTRVTTLVARRGTVQLLVSANATVAREKALLSRLFARVPDER